MIEIDVAVMSSELDGDAEPLLFQRREFLDEMEVSATTTSCVKTKNPTDYGPDD